MYPIDVHIAHMPGENQQWWQECQKSLKGHPINIYQLDGIKDNVFEMRRKGFLMGTAPYVSFVDPDDIVMPNAFKECLKVLAEDKEKKIVGAFTCSDTIDKNGNTLVKNFIPPRPWTRTVKLGKIIVHQIVVLRREIVEKCLLQHYTRETLPTTTHSIIFTEGGLYAVCA